MKDPAHKDQIEVYYLVDRLLNGLYVNWSTKKMTLHLYL